MRAVLLSLVVSIMLISCASVPLLGTPTMEAEEYEVYRSVIDAMYIHDQTELIVIMDRTGIGRAQDLEESLAYVTENIIGVEDETVNGFRDANGESHLLRDDLDLGFTCVLLSEEETRDIFDSGGWDEFYARYPHSQGIMTVSRVGFNRERDQALVYVGNQSHWLGGAGYYLFLTKEEGVWRIQEEIMVWIS